MIFHLVCALGSVAFGSFALGVSVGRAQGNKAKRDFEDWRAEVLDSMAQGAKDARDWRKFSDHVIAMGEQRAK